MKKIYRTIVLLSATAVLGTSCSDWLNVYPSDQIKEEFLFETGNGYRAALNGVYRKMASWSIYGSNLKWSARCVSNGLPVKSIEFFTAENQRKEA